MSESDDPRHAWSADLVATGRATPSWIVSHELPLQRAPEAYQHFDARRRQNQGRSQAGDGRLLNTRERRALRG
jgi:threonine dehydrogenase-like Zn-dependent dehydrogenase